MSRYTEASLHPHGAWGSLWCEEISGSHPGGSSRRVHQAKWSKSRPLEGGLNPRKVAPVLQKALALKPHNSVSPCVSLALSSLPGFPQEFLKKDWKGGLGWLPLAELRALISVVGGASGRHQGGASETHQANTLKGESPDQKDGIGGGAAEGLNTETLVIVPLALSPKPQQLSLSLYNLGTL